MQKHCPGIGLLAVLLTPVGVTFRADKSCLVASLKLRNGFLPMLEVLAFQGNPTMTMRTRKQNTAASAVLILLPRTTESRAQRTTAPRQDPSVLPEAHARECQRVPQPKSPEIEVEACVLQAEQFQR